MEQDKPETFAKEYQNNPVSGMMAKFHKEDFRYWAAINNEYVLYDENSHPVARGPLSGCRAVVGCDLAWETKRSSDYSVVVPVFMTPDSEFLVDTYVCKKGMRPHELEEILFSMEQRLRSLTNQTVYIGFEKANLEKVIQHLLRQAMRQRNHYLNFKAIQWDGDKIKRIVTRLEPRYAQHVMFHKKGMGDLETQLLRVPSGTHDDLADALQAAVSMLNYAPKKSTGKKLVASDDPGFDKLREMMVVNRERRRKRFVFGKKAQRFGVPYTKAIF